MHLLRELTMFGRVTWQQRHEARQCRREGQHIWLDRSDPIVCRRCWVQQ